MQISLKKQVIIIIILVTLLSSLSSGIIFFIQQKKNLDLKAKNQTIQLVKLLADAIRYPLLFSDNHKLKNAINIFKEDKNLAYITIFDKDGKILMHSDILGKNIPSENLKDIKKLLQEKEYPLLNKKTYRNTFFVYEVLFIITRDSSQQLTTPIQESELIGLIKLGYSLEEITDILTNTKMIISLSCLFTILIGIITSSLWLKGNINPLRKLAKMTNLIAQGKLEAWEDIKNKSEIGSINKDIKTIIYRLETHQEEITNQEKDFQKLINEQKEIIQTLERELAQLDKLAVIKELGNGIQNTCTNFSDLINEHLSQITELLKNKPRLNEEEIKKLQKETKNIKEKIDSFTKISDNLKDITNEKKIPTEPLDINALLENLIVPLKKLFTEKEVLIHKYLSDDIQKIMGEPESMNKIFSAIFSNALKFTEKGDEVSIYTSLRSIENTKLVEIKIRDTGCGIPDKNMGKIFLPFFTTKEKDSIGLGLPLCYNLVKTLNGTIEINSLASRGTTVIILFPI